MIHSDLFLTEQSFPLPTLSSALLKSLSSSLLGTYLLGTGDKNKLGSRYLASQLLTRLILFLFILPAVSTVLFILITVLEKCLKLLGQLSNMGLGRSSLCF